MKATKLESDNVLRRTEVTIRYINFDETALIVGDDDAGIGLVVEGANVVIPRSQWRDVAVYREPFWVDGALVSID